MKNLILTIALLIGFAIVAESQIATIYLKEGQTYAEYTTDVTLTNAVSQYIVFKAPQPWYTAQVVTVDLDSLAGNHTAMKVVLAGRVSDLMGWTLMDSVTWDTDNAWKSTDTTIAITHAAEVPYREFRVAFTGAGTGTTTLANIEFKQFYGLP